MVCSGGAERVVANCMKYAVGNGGGGGLVPLYLENFFLERIFEQ